MEEETNKRRVHVERERKKEREESEREREYVGRGSTLLNGESTLVEGVLTLLFYPLLVLPSNTYCYLLFFLSSTYSATYSTLLLLFVLFFCLTLLGDTVICWWVGVFFCSALLLCFVLWVSIGYLLAWLLSVVLLLLSGTYSSLYSSFVLLYPSTPLFYNKSIFFFIWGWVSIGR